MRNIRNEQAKAKIFRSSQVLSSHKTSGSHNNYVDDGVQTIFKVSPLHIFISQNILESSSRALCESSSSV